MASLTALRRIEAGLRAELEVLRSQSVPDLAQDVASSSTAPQLELAALHRIRAHLQAERARGELELARALSSVRSLSSCAQTATTPDTTTTTATSSLLPQQVKLLRRRTLQFAKAQYPAPQPADEFEGGDFWDACVAHCAAAQGDEEDEGVEFSPEREGALAELLLQTGLFVRCSSDGNGGKRIRLVPDAFH